MDNSRKFILFADDANIFINAPSSEELYIKANALLQKLNHYIDANYLHINLKKSKYILFRSNRARVEDIPLYYDNFQLERVTSTKFLGILISDTLVWDERIQLITRRLIKISGSLFKLARCLPKDMRRTVYFALVNFRLCTESQYGALVDPCPIYLLCLPPRRKPFALYLIFRG